MQSNCEKSCNWTNDGRVKKEITVLVLHTMKNSPLTQVTCQDDE
jgi:hypothetical protein